MVEILRVMAIVEILWYARITSMCTRVVMQACLHTQEDPQPWPIFG